MKLPTLKTSLHLEPNSNSKQKATAGNFWKSLLNIHFSGVKLMGCVIGGLESDSGKGIPVLKQN